MLQSFLLLLYHIRPQIASMIISDSETAPYPYIPIHQPAVLIDVFGIREIQVMHSNLMRYHYLQKRQDQCVLHADVPLHK